MTTCQLDMKEKVAPIEAVKVLLSKLDAELLVSARWRGTKGVRTRDGFFETIPPMYLPFGFHVEKAIKYYCSNEVFELVSFISEL